MRVFYSLEDVLTFGPCFFPCRCCCSLRIMGNTCWAWRIFCRNTLWWRPTSASRPTESETSTATLRSSPMTWTVRQTDGLLLADVPSDRNLWYFLSSLPCSIHISSSSSSGYKPCDPQIIRDRVAHMDFCYQELSQLAAERRARLEESRRLWKFFWEMAEEVINIAFIVINYWFIQAVKWKTS